MVQRQGRKHRPHREVAGFGEAASAAPIDCSCGGPEKSRDDQILPLPSNEPGRTESPDPLSVSVLKPDGGLAKTMEKPCEVIVTEVYGRGSHSTDGFGWVAPLHLYIDILRRDILGYFRDTCKMST
jgi:hypothetical protein